MPKKFMVSLVCLVALLSLLVAGCAKEVPPTPTPEKPAPVPEAPKKSYTLLYNITYPPPLYDYEAKAVACDLFAKKIEEATNGRIKVRVYYSNALAPQAQGLDAIRKGVIDLEGCSSYWTGTIPETDFVWLPFWSKGEEHAMHVMHETKVGEIFEKSYNKQGCHVLFYWPVSIEGYMSTKPIRKFEDAKGLVCRVGSTIWTEWYKWIGMAPANVAVAEQYEALMRGTMDATIYPIYTIETYKFYEVCKYLVVPGFVDPMLCYTFMRQDQWEEFQADPELKAAFDKVLPEMEKLAVEGSQKLTNSVMDMCAKYGVEVIHLPKAEFDKFVQSGMRLWDEVFAPKSADCAEMIKVIKADQAEWIKTSPEYKEWEERWLE